MAMIICKECGKDISSDARICPNCGKRLKIGIGKIFFTIVIAIITISILFGWTKSILRYGLNKNLSSNQSTNFNSQKVQNEAQKWTEICTLSGNGIKKSSIFKLVGNESRVHYKYRAAEGLDAGYFSIYFLDRGKDPLRDGGIPEVMTTSVKEDSESSIQKSEGEYYIFVNAAGDWSVLVEEKR